jgi:YrbI family 3-deoxy-D-manno-octulosonate 8-phosphate phosphatase
MLVMDVDGTLTDGAMYFSPEGEALKRFSTRDGMGVTLLRRAGIDCAIITSENSEIARRRAEKLRIEHLILHSHDKTTDLLALMAQLQVPMEAVAYIGDDVNDGPVMRHCGLTACPSDAVEAIKDRVHYVCTAAGGNGAVRELAEMILTAQGHPITLPEGW